MLGLPQLRVYLLVNLGYNQNSEGLGKNEAWQDALPEFTTIIPYHTALYELGTFRGFGITTPRGKNIS